MNDSIPPTGTDTRGDLAEQIAEIMNAAMAACDPLLDSYNARQAADPNFVFSQRITPPGFVTFQTLSWTFADQFSPKPG